ncbi:MAG: hypothetical protein U0360_04855 [Dehalococcoidia bacterium]
MPVTEEKVGGGCRARHESRSASSGAGEDEAECAGTLQMPMQRRNQNGRRLASITAGGMKNLALQAKSKCGEQAPDTSKAPRLPSCAR